MPYMNFKDLNMYYEDMGCGEPILFLHSHFSRSLLAFGAQIQPFQGEYRCLFPDFRGHGRTKCESLEWDSRKIADDMAGFLDALEIPSAHLFAYSFGTTVGMYMASKYPEKVRSLIAIGAGTEPNPEGSEDFLPESIIKRNDNRMIRDMTARHFEAHRGNWETFMEQTVLDWRQHPNLTEEEWDALSCPLFFINGDSDPFGSCRQLKEKCPHAKIFEVPNCGHRPHFVMEHAKEVNERALDFLRELGSGVYTDSTAGC